ncbi:PAS domain-containing protein [Asticcacaulis sp.]|uniref:PAS domain-containing protein n=1 Tax=Asticcacaulis sp. TaxID=1872648 RepID=UPI003F7C9DDE
MLLQSEHDLIALLGVAAFILLALAIVGGVIASLKSFQVRQFQDLLFKAERKIDNLERRMFNVLNAVPVALVETDNTGKFTFANRAAHQLLGRKDSELLGLRFHSATWGITYPDGRMIPADLLPIARTLRGQTVKGFQHLLVNHGSREKVLVSVTSMPIMNGAGEVIGSTAAMVELETSSGEGIDDLNGLWRGHWFASATVPFWGLDSKGQVIDINNAALDAFEMTREQALGQNWTQFFVADSDFQKAIDYLGDRLDETSPHSQTSMQLTLKAPNGDSQPCVVTAWVVRTHEGGESGLTVTALPSGILPAAAPVTAPANEAHEIATQELADHRLAEQARAALGVGTWQYDADADTIVEDAGMMALIGRDYPGGPTLISDADQAVADTAFGQLMSGESDHLALDIKVTRPDGGERWIALEGQAKTIDGQRHIYGVAFDCTAWKSQQAEPEPVVQTTGISEAELEDALSEARETARESALAEARTAHEAELEAVRIEAALERESAITEAAAVAREEALSEMQSPYDWHTPTVAPLPDPVIVHEPDPLVLAENESLKAQIAETEKRHDALQAQLDMLLATRPDEEGRIAEMSAELSMARAVQAALETELDALRNTPVIEPDYSAHDARIRALQAELETAEADKADLDRRLRELAETPAPEPDYSEHEARITALEDRLKTAQVRHDDLAQRYHVLSNAPAQEPDYRMHEARITGLKNALDQAAARHAELQAAHKALLEKPAPEPDASEWEAKVKAAQFEVTKWQAAYHDAQARLEQANTAKASATDQGALEKAQAQLSEMQAQLDKLHEALGHAQRYETVGRLTSDVAQDFAQMLGVINGALEVMARQPESPENIRRLSEAALTAGKRGERLTRQLQAFQSEDY